MADEHRSKVEQGAQRVAEWLAEHREGFEHGGVGEDELAAAAGLAEAELTEALDYLENREEVVRIPQSISPPRDILKPGRGWPDVRDEILKRRAGGGA